MGAAVEATAGARALLAALLAVVAVVGLPAQLAGHAETLTGTYAWYHQAWWYEAYYSMSLSSHSIK